MRAWVTRNRWALVALVVLIPAAVLAAMSVSFFRYFGNLDQHPPAIAEGDAGDYVPDRSGSGTPPPARISLTSYVVVPWDTDTGKQVGLTEGSEAVSAIIHVDATREPSDVFSCNAILTAQGPGGEITWVTASSPDIDYFPGGDLESYCDLSSGEAFDWEAVFVVPEGVGDSADLFITNGGLQPRRVLQLEH